MTDRSAAHPAEGRPSAIVPGNHQLARLPPRDLALLMPHLERVVLRKGHVIHEPGDLVPYVFLPELGTLIGLFAPTVDGHAIKVACVDRTCALAMAEAVDDGFSLTRATVVLPGPALRIGARDFAAVVMRSDPVRRMIRRTARMLMAEMAHNAACNAAHSAEQRIARWLLAAHSLMQDEARPDADTEMELPQTQERLGDMLGLERTTVTAIARRLQAAGLVRYARGHLHVCDRAGLGAVACGCNERIARVHRKLMQ